MASDWPRTFFTARKVTSQIRLPKLNLSTFDGNILCWQEFWDIFKSSFHEQEIPDVTNFSNLKGSLHGIAANAIHGISFTSDNYHTTIELLKERFRKGEVIIETLYSQLQHMPTATNRISDIKSTYVTGFDNTRLPRTIINI